MRVADATIFLADHEQQVLTPLPPVPPQLSPLDIDTTVAGRAFQLERPFTVATDDEDGSVNLWLPLLDSAERIGVLHLRSPAGSDEVVARCQDLASLVAELVVSQMQYGDALIQARRLREMTLAAELRWSQLPPLTFTGERVGIACVLEPAYDVAGDAFDYAVNDGRAARAHRGRHGARARGQPHGQPGGGRLPPRPPAPARPRVHLSGRGRRLEKRVRPGPVHDRSAGHARLGKRGLTLAQRRPSSPASAPPGPGSLGATRPAITSLRPRGRAAAADGSVARARRPALVLHRWRGGGAPQGRRFGQDQLIDLTRRAMADQQTLSETVRRLVRSVRSYPEGTLDDDATILLVEWHPE